MTFDVDTVTLVGASGQTNGQDFGLGAPAGRDGSRITAIVPIGDRALRVTLDDGSAYDVPFPPGIPGLNGADGVTPTFIDGKVTQLPPGSELRITTRSTGVPNQYAVDFAVPVDATASTGPAGVGVEAITQPNATTARVVLTNGTFKDLTLPAGKDGTNGANGANGADGSALTSYADRNAAGQPLPYARTQLERNRDGRLSIMNWIAPAKRTDIQNNVWTGDLKPEIQSAIGSGENIGLPLGTYPLLSGLTFPAAQVGQEFIGEGDRSDIVFKLSQGFDTSPFAVMKFAHFAKAEHFSFDCYQPQSQQGTKGAPPQFSAIVQYPWLIDLSGSTRARVDDVSMQKGWNGIYAGGNAGGCNFGRIEDGTLNQGIFVDNPLDFFTIETWESWVYGFGNTGLEDWAYANPGSLQFRAADGLSVNSINMWKKGIVYDNASQLDATFGIVKLDGGNASFKAVSGQVAIGVLNSLTDVALPSVENTGAEMSIGVVKLRQADAALNMQAPLLRCSGGATTINGGIIRHNSTFPEVEVTGGSLDLANIAFLGPGDTAKPNGQIRQSGTGVLGVSKCRSRAGSTGGGFFIRTETNNAGHSITGNVSGGRGYRFPASPTGAIANNVGGTATTF